jgi:hypothetical protein
MKANRHILVIRGISSSLVVDNKNGPWVRYRDYVELQKYADTLAEGLPCLPKDVEVLRNANVALAQRVFELENMLGIEH